MGKSDKKVKSERINQLRKQYDAFLEEDKKRKERNEYILGRLDKMRYCTAMVPVRQKPTLFIDRRDNFSTSSSLSQLNKSSLDIPRHFDETAMLQEISKKYILIPKIRSSIETDISISNLKPAFEENGDWKSKYEILDQLKKREKESESPAFDADHSQRNNYDNSQVQEPNASLLGTKHSQSNNVKNVAERDVKRYDTESCDNKVDQTALAYQYDLPEKDKIDEIYTEVQDRVEAKLDHKHVINEEPQIKANTTNSTLPQIDDNFHNNNEQLETHPYIYNETESTPTYYPESATENQNIDYNTQNFPAEEYNEQIDQAMYRKQYSPVEDKDVAETEKVFPEDIQAIGVINPDDLIKQMNTTAPNEINTPALHVTSDNIQAEENDQYPIETIHVQDFTPGNHVTLQDGINVNPEEYALDTVTPTYEYNPSSEVAEHIENTVDTSGIEAFDAEQREMFYNEGTNENYEYNQENLPEGCEQGLPTESTEYPQSETAVYYEGYEADQAYPVELGEQDDTQRYDHHYEQQYATNYVQQELSQEGYEQEYTEDPQSEGNMNQIQENLEQLQYEQQHEYEPVENIEQQLDTEQGYSTAEQINMSNIEKPIEDLQTKAPQPEKKTS